MRYRSSVVPSAGRMFGRHARCMDILCIAYAPVGIDWCRTAILPFMYFRLLDYGPHMVGRDHRMAIPCSSKSASREGGNAALPPSSVINKLRAIL